MLFVLFGARQLEYTFFTKYSYLTLWQAERHFCHLRFKGAATILSFGHSMFMCIPGLDSIGSAVGKRPIEHVVATGEWPNEYVNEHSHAIRP